MTLALIHLPFADFPIWALLFFTLLGFVGLALGGDWLTQGAAAISVNLKINPVVVGLTIVSIATSMPEMVTSLVAARSSPELAMGNILGSNVANIGLILGVAALIAPLAVQIRLIRREVPFLVAITILFSIFSWGGLSRWEGLVMLSITIGYIFYVVRSAKEESSEVETKFQEQAGADFRKSNWQAFGLVVVGGILLALGAKSLVDSSVEMASRLGVSETLVGLTIVAIGTSLPELAASVAAARSGHGDICAGNVVGSNLFNILLIGGGVATLVPIPVATTLFFVEFPAMLGLTGLLMVFFKTGSVVTWREGVFLLFLYIFVLGLSSLSQLGFLF
ncbi:MAG: calcium/sodium antiporter [Verrucomicrobiota bacterium]